MFPENQNDENVVHLKTQADLAHERARRETASIEKEIFQLGERHRHLVKQASLLAISNGSPLFSHYAQVLFDAEQTLQEAEQLLAHAKPLFAQQLASFDVAKTAHESYTKSIREALSLNPEHQNLLAREREIGNKIIEITRQNKEAQRRIPNSSSTSWALKLVNRIVHGAGLRTKSPRKQAEFNVDLRLLHEELRSVHLQVLSMRESALASIHSSSAAFDIVKRGFQGVQARKDELTFDVAVKRQTVHSLRDLTHPVAQQAVSEFEDLIVTAKYGDKGHENLIFALGSKSAADQLIAEMKILDERELRLEAELHYAQESEERLQSRLSSFGSAARVIN